MSKNYLFKHIECSNSSGFAAEDFYISRHDDRKDDGLLELTMFIDSRWREYCTGRESSESTACIALILAGRQLRDGVILEAGDAVIETCRQGELLLSAVPGEELHRQVLIIARNAPFEMLADLLFPGGTAILRGCGAKAAELFEAIAAECRISGSRSHLSVLLFELLQYLYSRRQLPELPESLKKALKFINDNGYEVLNREDICRAAGVSDRQLNILFRRHLHRSPGQYLIGRRMDFAAKLLESGRFQVKECAKMSGFASAEFFIRAFKKYTGCTPGRWFAGCRKNGG